MTITHGGSGSSYSSEPYYCRCDECRAANTRRVRRRRAERAVEILADPSLAEHGNPNTYKNWGCRCDACTKAHSKDLATRRRGGATS